MSSMIKASKNSTEMRELASRICRDYLTGAWKTISANDLHIKRISGGLSNFLYYVSLPDDIDSCNNVKNTKRARKDASLQQPKEVLVRIYGRTHGEQALETVLTDTVVFTLLSERKLGPKLHGIFPGGRIEQYIPCAQGRAAWLERGRRCSLSDHGPSCQRRWGKRNRIHDASLGSSDDDDFLGALRGPSSFANAFLYVGLGTVALGLVILFVGTGEKCFKTIELRLIGPSLIGIGLLCCILRIFFCICPSSCISSKRRKLKQKNAKVDVDHTTSLLCADSKRVSIQRSTETIYPDEAIEFMKKYPHSKMNEGMETLRHLASTSMFLQSEKNISSTTAAVRINEKPDFEPAKKEDQLEIVSISDDEECGALVKLNGDSYKSPPKKKEPTQYSIMDAAVKTSDTSFVLEPVREEQPRPNKLSRSRAPLNQPKLKDTEIPLVSLDATSHNSNGIEMSSKPENGAYGSTTLSLVPSYSQSKNDGNSLAMSRMDPSKTIQDGSTKITMVQSAVTSFGSNVNSIEPELVLSPAKLGQ